ncbi:MAG: GNAT family N-acetyltransferase [Pirellulaceae bacterium]
MTLLTSSLSFDERIRNAIPTFVHGFCLGKSLVYPREAVPFGDGIWVLRDQERKNPKDYRKEEWVSYSVSIEETLRIAAKHTRGRYCVSAFLSPNQDEQAFRETFRNHGMRLIATEPFFVHDLNRIPRKQSPAKLKQIQSDADNSRFAKTSRSRSIPETCFGNDGIFRQYIAEIDGEIVGWVRSVPYADQTWVADMYVRDKWRRLGIGAHMLSHMLRDDRKLGFAQSVLLSTHTGAHLYPRLGYEQIATLFIYFPQSM